VPPQSMQSMTVCGSSIGYERYVRVVAGSARGRRLQAPPGSSTRPTADRVREATFNALGSLDAVTGEVLDLFAGSGALGIEALSRGADRATFVDSDPRAVAVVRANLEATGLADRASVVRGDALRFLAGAGHFDLALLDPPYTFGDDEWAALLGALDADVAVLESDREVPVPAPWEVLRSKRYGGTVVLLAQRVGRS
jgi:16S rRNA (guanine966-N2)-methyltransferase